MANSTQGKPFENTQMAVYLRGRIDELAQRKSQRDIAIEAGYDKPNIISMFKRGETKVPFDKLPNLSKALEVDVMRLLQLYLEQPGGWPAEVSGPIFSRIMTENEVPVVTEMRKVVKGDPKFTKDQIKAIANATKEIMTPPRATASA